MSIHWTLALLVVAALPTVLTSGWRPGVERRVQEEVAQHQRRAQHYYRLTTTAPSARELRVLGLGERVATARRTSWEAWYAPTTAVRWGSALWYTLAWTAFGLGFVAAVVWVTNGLDASVADVLLVLAAGGRLSGYVGATVGEIGFLRGVWLDGSRRLAWLEDYAADQRTGDLAPPGRLDAGIRFDDVSFAYPGARDRLVLEHVDLDLPAGAVVAVVGENGAGKSTLVKLLTQMYVPTSGRILVDGMSLADVDPELWRDRVAGAFQDFYRFELAAQQSIGLGDLPRLDDPDAASAAVGRAGADDVVRRLEEGLATQLGPQWPGGVDLSFGQWQKVALARGFMREDPLLLVLDEPTAALDAETEHALFERFAEAARTRVGRRADHRARLAPVLDGADGRPDRGARRVAGGRGRQPRRPDGSAGQVRRALRRTGRVVPLAAGLGVRRDPDSTAASAARIRRAVKSAQRSSTCSRVQNSAVRISRGSVIMPSRIAGSCRPPSKTRQTASSQPPHGGSQSVSTRPPGSMASASSSSISRPTASRGDSPTSTTPPGRSQSRL